MPVPGLQTSSISFGGGGAILGGAAILSILAGVFIFRHSRSRKAQFSRVLRKADEGEEDEEDGEDEDEDEDAVGDEEGQPKTRGRCMRKS